MIRNEVTIRITIAVAARGANMATRYNNESTACETNSNRQRRTSDAQVAPKPRRLRKPARVLALLAGLGLTVLPNTGCSIANNLQSQFKHHTALDDFLVGYRNDAWAAKAWHCRKQRFCNRRNLSDLEAGFRAGYMSVAEGGNGCVPAVCPQAYWGFQYQDCNGQSRMNSWFEGFPLGVAAAEEDGIGHWSQVPTSLPMPAPVQPMVPMGAAAAGVGAGMMPGAEPILAPVPDPAANKAVMPPAAPKSAARTAAPKTAMPKTMAPQPAAPKSAAEPLPVAPKDMQPMAPVAPVPNKPAAPGPLKIETPPAENPAVDDIFNVPANPAEPKANDDPFGL